MTLNSFWNIAKLNQIPIHIIQNYCYLNITQSMRKTEKKICHMNVEIGSMSPINSSPPSAAYIRQWIGTALIQIAACCLLLSYSYLLVLSISFSKMHLIRKYCEICEMVTILSGWGWWGWGWVNNNNIIMGRMGICFTSVATSWWREACCLLLCFPTGTCVLCCT